MGKSIKSSQEQFSNQIGRVENDDKNVLRLILCIIRFAGTIIRRTYSWQREWKKSDSGHFTSVIHWYWCASRSPKGRTWTEKHKGWLTWGSWWDNCALAAVTSLTISFWWVSPMLWFRRSTSHFCALSCKSISSSANASATLLEPNRLRVFRLEEFRRTRVGVVASPKTPAFRL